MSEAMNRKKISVDNIKLSDQPVGYTFSGIYKGQVLSAPFINEDGESKQLTSVVFDKNGNRTAYLADKGLLQTLSEALVTEGMLIEVVKLEKAKLKGGRTMNQYEVYELEGPQK